VQSVQQKTYEKTAEIANYTQMGTALLEGIKEKLNAGGQMKSFQLSGVQ
jgi:hypothetical protein